MDKSSFRPPFFDEIQSKLSELARSGPAAHLEQNAKAMLSSAFSKMDLVTREEFDIQIQMNARLRERLERLEARLQALEAGAVATTQASPENTAS